MGLPMNNDTMEVVEYMRVDMWCMPDWNIGLCHKAAETHFCDISCSTGKWDPVVADGNEIRKASYKLVSYKKRVYYAIRNKETDLLNIALKAHSQVWDNFWQLKAFLKWWKMLFISPKKLFSFSWRCLYFLRYWAMCVL